VPTYNPQLDPSALAQRLQDNDDLLVVCYCAQWCDTCTQYQPQFDALAERLPRHAFIWIDIEENPEMLGDEDVENFPTVLVQNARANLFFGPQLPYISHLEKLLEHVDELPPTSEGPPLLRPMLAQA